MQQVRGVINIVTRLSKQQAVESSLIVRRVKQVTLVKCCDVSDMRREREERTEGSRLHPTGQKRTLQSASSVIVEGCQENSHGLSCVETNRPTLNCAHARIL